MSENVLIQLIRRPKPKPMKEKPREPHYLIFRMRRRRSRNNELTRILAKLQILDYELWIIKHVRKCRMCQAEFQLGVERYMGSRLPWFLNLQNEIGWPEIYEEDKLYKDAPRPQNYKIGSYGRESDDTLRFIMDRMSWAETKIREDVEANVDYFVALEKWDLDSAPPILESHLDFFIE